MATSITNGTFASIPATRSGEVRQRSRSAVYRPRKLSIEAARGIELLAHAAEYLADEFAQNCMTSSSRANPAARPEIVAIELLMERNRAIYFSCPEVPPFSQRLRAGIRSLFPLKQS